MCALNLGLLNLHHHRSSHSQIRAGDWRGLKRQKKSPYWKNTSKDNLSNVAQIRQPWCDAVEQLYLAITVCLTIDGHLNCRVARGGRMSQICTHKSHREERNTGRVETRRIDLSVMLETISKSEKGKKKKGSELVELLAAQIMRHNYLCGSQRQQGWYLRFQDSLLYPLSIEYIQLIQYIPNRYSL